MAGELVEFLGNAGAVLFWQSAPIGLNVGVTPLVIVMSMVVVTAH